MKKQKECGGAASEVGISLVPSSSAPASEASSSTKGRRGDKKRVTRRGRDKRRVARTATTWKDEDDESIDIFGVCFFSKVDLLQLF